MRVQINVPLVSSLTLLIVYFQVPSLLQTRHRPQYRPFLAYLTWPTVQSIINSKALLVSGAYKIQNKYTEMIDGIGKLN